MKPSAFILTALIVLTPMICMAQPNSVDSNFGVNGKDQYAGVALQNSPGDTIRYPTLIQSFLNIRFKNKAAGKIAINIYSPNGKPVVSKSIQSTTQLDLRPLTAGVYIIKITDEIGKELCNGKVIKQ
jgi:hypothetical protein